MMDRKLWKITPSVSLPHGAWPEYRDVAMGFVVCATSEAEARQIAHEHAGDEKCYFGSPWLDRSLSDCTELTPKHPIGLVLRDFLQIG